MSLTCAVCKENISKFRNPGVKCCGPCGKSFHVKCAHISVELLKGISDRSANWLCEDCRGVSNHSIIDGDLLDSESHVGLTDIMKQLKIIEEKLSTLDELNNNILSLQAENTTLTARVNKLEEQLAVYNSKLNLLDADIDKPNQTLNAASITIWGLPMKHDDIQGVIVNTLCKLVQSFEADDIVSIKPVHRTKNNTVSATNNPPSNKKSILNDFFIVKLKSVTIKNDILDNMRKLKILNTKDLDVILPINHPEQRIYIMHHLTRFQAQLYREAKNIKVKNNYKYLWCKSGQIYIRKSAGSDVHRIHSMDDIFLINKHNSIDVNGKI